ncbi:MAG: hypothetical protein EOP49_04885 [Sphingobacteriales bacterium]|nr:MAG: hypothetical protein EOP49_04885 [Sphingobacteriales bacterium]
MMLNAIKSLLRKKKANPFSDMDLERPVSSYRVDREPVFISGIGRSGTHFMATVFNAHNDFRSLHHDDVADPIADVYTWFAKWYGIPANAAGFLRGRGHLIEKFGAQGKRYLEANAMICLNLEELVQAYGGKLIIMVRSPRNVVESHFHKGFFTQVDYENALPVPGFNYYHKRPSHFFSRVMPKEEQEFKTWKEYTRIGKCAWKWRMCYEEIFAQLERHNLWDKTRFVYLNDFDYNAYRELCTWLGTDNIMEKSAYDQIVNNKPGKSKGKPDSYVWTEADKKDFNSEIGKVLPLFTMIENKKTWLQ